MILRALLLLVLIDGIVIRHDRDPARYLIDPTEYPAVFEVFKGDGMGTVIASEWALTAAHVAESLVDTDGHEVIIDGQPRRIERVVLHPSWNGGSPRYDAALLHFSPPVSASLPIAPYREADEMGQTVVFVGTGDFGTGLTGGVTRDETWRAATNRVADVSERHVVFVFDPPDSDDVTDLEGISGPGDSGGPALVTRDGELMTLGISSAGSEPDGQAPGTYGSREFYTRVSAITDWLDSVVGVGGTPVERPTRPNRD